MLYERWQQIVRQFPCEIALRDCASGRQFTFKELDAQASIHTSTHERVAFPQGAGSDFIFRVLRAWRRKQVVCPLEIGQLPPEIGFEILPDACAHLKMTSATTGAPRMITFTEEQLVADAENIVVSMGLRIDSPNLGVISLAHSYGFSNLVLPLLLHGIPLVLAPSPLPETMKQLLAEMSDVTLPAVPALWRAWHEAGVLSNVRLAISAGAPLPVSLEKSIFAQSGIKVHNFYGSSECGGIAYDASDTPREDSSCVGTPLKNVNVSVGENGCMEVRGPAVASTYWPTLNENLSNGVFRTSDLAEIIHGSVHLRGRVSDLINVAGRKLFPETVERVLLAHSSVADCLVFGAPSRDAERSDIVVACVVPRSGADVDGLKKYLLSQMPAWQVPREWMFVDSLQGNSRGKVSRNTWREKFLSGRDV